MTTLQVFSAVTGDLILQTELPEEEVFLHLSDRICAATGVPNFCQQLMSQDGDIIRDWKAWDQLGQPLNLQVAFQMATKSLSHELLEFSSTGDHDKVQEILQQFQDPNVVDPAGESPMVKASRGGHLEVVQLLLEALADLRPGPPGQPGPPGALPLLAASTGGHREVVQQLLWARCDSELRDALGNTALSRAAEAGQVEVARTLLLTANVDAENLAGQTPLLIAAMRGLFSMMCLLLRNGADKDVADMHGYTALMASSSRGDLRGVTYLLEACAQVNKMTSKGRTALYMAAETGHFKALRCLLAARADPDVRDQHGCTALFLAAQLGRSDVVGALLEARADHDLKTVNGRSPMPTAVHCGHVEVVKLFLAHASSAPCDASSLCIAVQNGHDEIVRCMLTSAGSAGSWTPTPETPLLMAAELGHANILRLLLEAGGHGDPGEALCLAAGRGHVAAATMLLHFRAEVNHRRSPSELSPLLLAAEHDSLEMLQLLLEARADPGVQDASGCGAVYIAAQMGHVDVLRRLLECRCSAEGSTETSPLHIARENGFAEVVKLLEDQ